MTTANLSSETLAYFTGNETYTWGPFRKFVMTDGCTYLCENGVGWFMDLIASHQTGNLIKKSAGFQFWKLMKSEKADCMAVAVCEDGNGNVFVTQNIEYTDFPFDRINGLDVYLEEGSIDGRTTVWVALLASER